MIFLAVSLVTAWVQSGFGATGIFTLAALVGASDIDAFVLSLAQGGAPGMSPSAVAAAVLIAASANNLAKAAYAIGFGGLATAKRPAILLSALALLGFAALPTTSSGCPSWWGWWRSPARNLPRRSKIPQNPCHASSTSNSQQPKRELIIAALQNALCTRHFSASC